MFELDNAETDRHSALASSSRKSAPPPRIVPDAPISSEWPLYGTSHLMPSSSLFLGCPEGTHLVTLRFAQGTPSAHHLRAVALRRPADRGHSH
ncbi:MAG: hypothetical protein AAF546_12765 [Verrucomicrobiota bacterium]